MRIERSMLLHHRLVRAMSVFPCLWYVHAYEKVKMHLIVSRSGEGRRTYSVTHYRLDYASKSRQRMFSLLRTRG